MISTEHKIGVTSTLLCKSKLRLKFQHKFSFVSKSTLVELQECIMSEDFCLSFK